MPLTWDEINDAFVHERRGESREHAEAVRVAFLLDRNEALANRLSA